MRQYLEEEDCYEATEVNRKIVGLPEDYRVHITNYINHHSCRNRIIMKFLVRVDEEIKKHGIEKLKEKYTQAREEAKKKIIDTNFRLILSKNLTINYRVDQVESGKLYNLVAMGETVQARFKVSSRPIRV